MILFDTVNSTEIALIVNDKIYNKTNIVLNTFDSMSYKVIFEPNCHDILQSLLNNSNNRICVEK